METSKTQPTATGVKSVAAARDPRRKILTAMEVRVPESTLPSGYATAMGFLVACLALLPLLYGALLVFLGWLAVWHLIQAYESLSYGPYFVFHLPMALLGILLVVFLIKPVFFRKKVDEGGVITLEKADQPLLFAAIEKLCVATGSNMPARIEVDCQANAHARFLNAADSIKGEGDLVLRIGLPLVVAFSVRQLSGVIGHELGHFNQRRGMTCSYLIRRLNSFFAKIVFQRDAIDQKLAALRNKRSGYARLLFVITWALVEPMRGVLWLMLLAGELLSCGMLRRMEHDADNVEAHLCGVNDFVRTSESLLLLSIASRQALSDLANSYNQQRLADDLPQLIVTNAGELREHRADILKILEASKTNWFDTHPCHNDRAAHVEQLGAAGLINCDDPATSLFAGFESVCRQATDSMYRKILKEDALAGIKLVPAKELAAERTSHRANTKALARYFSGHVVAGRPIFPESIDPKTLRSADALRQVKTAREAMEAKSDRLRSTIKQYAEAVVMLPIAGSQLTLCQIFRNNPRSRPLSNKLQKVMRKQGTNRTQAIAFLDEFEELGRQRLTCALRILSNPAVAERIGTEVTAGRIAVNQMMSVCSVLEECVPEIRQLGELHPAIHVLHIAHNPKQPNPSLVKQILASTREALKLLKDVQAKLESTAFPFAHGKEGGITLGDFVVSRLPNANDPGDTCAAINAASERYHDVAFRALSILTLWAEKAETAANLEPLSEPEKDPAEIEMAAAVSSKRSQKYWIGYGSRAVAGVMLVSGLIELSINPPELPAMPWQSAEDRSYHFQPQAFSVAYQPMPSPQFPQFQAGYQGRVISVQAGQPHVMLPPGFVPPSYDPPRMMTPHMNMPGPIFPEQLRTVSPPNFPQSNIRQPRIVQPYTPPPPPVFNPNGGGGMRGGGGGGHR